MDSPVPCGRAALPLIMVAGRRPTRLLIWCRPLPVLSVAGILLSWPGCVAPCGARPRPVVVASLGALRLLSPPSFSGWPAVWRSRSSGGTSSCCPPVHLLLRTALGSSPALWVRSPRSGVPPPRLRLTLRPLCWRLIRPGTGVPAGRGSAPPVGGRRLELVS